MTDLARVLFAYTFLYLQTRKEAAFFLSCARHEYDIHTEAL